MLALPLISLLCAAGVNGPIVSGGPSTSPLTGSAPISISGGVVSCILATGSVAGCVSTGTQTFAGNKTFAGLTASYLQTTQVIPALDTQALQLAGRRDHADTSSTADLQVCSYNTRDDGTLIVEVANGCGGSSGLRRVTIDGTGTVRAGMGNSNTASFIDANGNSGHISLTCQGGAGGCYVTITGGLAAHYFGHHGAVTFTGLQDDNGFVAEFQGPGGGSTAKKLMINYQGGITQYFSGLTLPNFAACTNSEPDPGDGGTLATDAGTAFDSTLQWDGTSTHWYACRATGSKGWQQIAYTQDQAPQTLSTCSSTIEGQEQTDVLSGASTGKRTKRCLCTSDGSAGYKWQNLATATLGTTTTCGTE